MMIKSSFAPIVPSSAKMLILGSLPGDKSLLEDQYYAHPQNRFWKILFTLYAEDYSTSYDKRINLLHSQQIALWDVCASALRPGSMDHAIDNVVPNPINSLLIDKEIRHVYFNGQKAEKLYRHFFAPLASVSYHTLPSSSPANATYSFEKLVKLWSTLRS